MTHVAASLGDLSRAEAAAAFDALFDEILERLMKGEIVRIPGFGTFRLKERAGRRGRNPATGEEIFIAARKMIHFRPASGARERVNLEGISAARPRRKRRKGARGRGGGAAGGTPDEPGAGGGGGDLPRGGAGGDEAVPRNGGEEAAAGNGGEEAAGNGGAGGPDAGAEPGDARPGREIRAWIDERAGAPEKPLERGETYTLGFKVGFEAAGNLLAGEDTSVADEEIPPGGLATEWTVASSQVEIRSHDGTAAVTRKEIAGETLWTARFPMLIPENGESPPQHLQVIPLQARDATLRVMLTVERHDSHQGRTLREVYRELTLRLAVGEPDLTRPPRPAARIEDDITLAPASHSLPTTPHEWATPPGEGVLSVARDSQTAMMLGDFSHPGFVPGDHVQWFAGSTANVAGRLGNLRASADRFRAVHGDYLDAIDAGDLDQRLGHVAHDYNHQNYHWDPPLDLADAAHKTAWDQVAVSKELRDLAFDGYDVYQKFFPQGSELRQALDALPRGFQINIFWLDGGSGWIPHVPWGLMYRQPAPPVGSPVDPMEFLGLAYRLGYASHRVQLPSRALGGKSARPAYYLYWGGARDATESEAERQRQAWQGLWNNHTFVPARPRTPDPKREILQLLEQPSPTPAPVLYLYCRASVGSGNNPVLQFGSGTQPGDRVERTEWGQGPLADRPLVFANACSTATADPYISNELQDRFFERGCRAYLGTEARVPIVLASRFASIFFHYFYRRAAPEPLAAGEAVAQARLFLWSNYRNIGGLLYSYVNEYKLYMAERDEVDAMRT